MTDVPLPVEIDRESTIIEHRGTDPETGHERVSSHEVDVVHEIRAVDCNACGYDRAVVERRDDNDVVRAVTCQACGEKSFPYTYAGDL